MPHRRPHTRVATRLPSPLPPALRPQAPAHADSAPQSLMCVVVCRFLVLCTVGQHSPLLPTGDAPHPRPLECHGARARIAHQPPPSHHHVAPCLCLQASSSSTIMSGKSQLRKAKSPAQPQTVRGGKAKQASQVSPARQLPSKRETAPRARQPSTALDASARHSRLRPPHRCARAITSARANSPRL